MVRKRVAAIIPLLVKGSNARECRSGGPTHDIELNPDRIALALCGNDYSFSTPDHATEWVKAR